MQSKFKLSVKAQVEIEDIFRYSFQKFGENQAVKYKTSLDDYLCKSKKVRMGKKTR